VTLAAQRPLKRRHGLPEEVDGPTIVILALVDIAKMLVRQGVEDDVPTSRGTRQGALASRDTLVMRA